MSRKALALLIFEWLEGRLFLDRLLKAACVERIECSFKFVSLIVTEESLMME